MRTLVTGGAGYIGSVMTRMLADEGHDVLVLDNLSQGHRRAVGGADLEVVDLNDYGPLVKTCLKFRPEACLHFAAHCLVPESMEKPLKYFRNNAGGSMNLLGALIEAGCGYLIFSSTCAVYGSPDRIPITEESATEPINPYGMSKLMFEWVLEQVSRGSPVKYLSLRYFNAAGADTANGLGEDHDPETHLIPRVVAVALGKEPRAVVFGNDYETPDGTCVRDYVHVVDLCRAHLLGLDHLTSGGSSGVFNLGNSRGFSVREVIESVKRVSGREFEVVDAERRPGDPPVLVASSSSIESRLGWRAEYTDIDDIVRTAWLWHREHPDGYE